MSGPNNSGSGILSDGNHGPKPRPDTLPTTGHASTRIAASSITSTSVIWHFRKLGLGLAFLPTIFASLAGAADNPISDACQVTKARAPVFVDRNFSTGAEVRAHFPAFGKSALLDSFSDPVRVIAIRGPRYGIPVVSRPGHDGGTDVAYDNVLCVVTASGDEWYFEDVPMDSYRP